MSRKLKEHENLYALKFNESDWQEIFCLGFEPFEISPDEEELTRGQWMAVAHMALGKAQCIREGQYDIGDLSDISMPNWAEQLEGIAREILGRFKPGDGNT